MSSTGVRSIILFSEVSIFHLFSHKRRTITLYKGPAVDATTKIRSVGQDACLVDITNTSSNPQSVVFTSDPDPGLCWYCRRMTKDETRVGLPIRMRDDKLHHVVIVDIEGTACNYSCAYSFLKEHSHEDSVYSGRLILAQQIHAILYPGTKLNPAPNFLLLQHYGGPLSDEEYDSGSCGFLPNPCLKYRVCTRVFEPSS